MMSYCYLGDRLNASGKSEAAVTARMRMGRMDKIKRIWGIAS